jgi:hypothetical protein
MKKFLKISGISLGVLFVAMLAAPFLFKDKIKAAIDEQIKQNINGNVWYDAESFSLSLFSHFPNLTVAISDIGLSSNAEAFKGDTLFAAKKFSVAVDVKSVLFGDAIHVNGVYLKQPKIVTIYDRTGQFSWDITYSDSTATPEPADTTASDMKINIEKWEIEDGIIVYDDQTMPMYMELKGFNHKGSGSINGDVYDLKTWTDIANSLVTYDGTTYLSGHKLFADAAMNIDLAKSIYTFKENEFAVNDFKFGMNGSIEMPADDIKMDITYGAKETKFKNLLSLIPAIYSKDFDKIETDGTIAFDGWVKGVYNETTMPGFGLTTLINNGYFKYPDLPESVKNVNMDLKLENKDGVIDHTLVNLKTFHMEMGKNPVDARFLMTQMNPYDIDANVLAKLNLEDVQKFYPIEGTMLKGVFGMDVKCKGKYSDEQKLMPMVTATMNLANGYVKSFDFPTPLEKVEFNATVKSNGDMPTSTFALDYFRLLLDNEPFEAKAFVKNFDDPNYEATIKGKIDLDKMTKIYPLEGTTLTGIILADLTTKGILSQVQAGNYGTTQSSGRMDIENLVYKSTDLPQGFTMTKGGMTLSPEKFNIETMTGMLGKSDYAITGYVSNYMGYMFGGKDTTLHGVMNLKSNSFDVNEWMAEDPNAPAPAPEEEVPMEVVEVPRNIDFTFNSIMTKVLYSNLTLADMTGAIIVKDAIVKLSNLKFKTLGGAFAMNGSYNAQDLTKPAFDMDMSMTDVAFKDAFNAFNTVKQMAGISQYMDGKMNLTLSAKGLLGQDMMPKYETLNGFGTLLTKSATITDNPALSTMAGLTKMNNLNPMTISDINAKFKIVDGSLLLDPFKVNAGQTKFDIKKGVNKLNGDVDYDIQLTTPSGTLGTAASSALTGLVGSTVAMPKDIIMDLNLNGPGKKPNVKILKTNFGEVDQNAVKNQVVNTQQVQDAKQQVDQAKQQAQQQVQQQVDQTKQQVQQQIDQTQQQVQQQVDQTKQQTQQQIDQQKKQAQDSAKKQLDALKKGIPKF